MKRQTTSTHNYSSLNSFSEDLQLDKKRFRVKHCPCRKSNKDGKFVPYKGHDIFGYCHSCGKTFLPDLPQRAGDCNNLRPKFPQTSANRSKPTQLSYIPLAYFKKSLTNYQSNNFVQFLLLQFGEAVATNLIERFFIGTSKHWNGATVFWQIDSSGKVRTGKIFLYDSSTGKRVKQPYNHVNWAHSLLKLSDFKLNQCFFGEHQLRADKSKPIAIVESEKTAIIASLYLPQFIWLATGGLQNLSQRNCNVLKGRNVILFPDLNCLKKWQEKAVNLKGLASLSVSELLEQKATEAERREGLDIADYLLKNEYTEFVSKKANPATNKKIQISKHNTHRESNYKSEQASPIGIENEINWKQELEELESFFKNAALQSDPIRLNKSITIKEPSLFVSSHLRVIKSQYGKQTFLPYLQRLQSFKFSLTQGRGHYERVDR